MSKKRASGRTLLSALRTLAQLGLNCWQGLLRLLSLHLSACLDLYLYLASKICTLSVSPSWSYILLTHFNWTPSLHCLTAGHSSSFPVNHLYISFNSLPLPIVQPPGILWLCCGVFNVPVAILQPTHIHKWMDRQTNTDRRQVDY